MRDSPVRRVRVGNGLWYAFGNSDGFALIEAPDNVTSAGIAIAISASGAFRKFEMTVLMTRMS
jgi:uncharacterized protein with GYD domain